MKNNKKISEEEKKSGAVIKLKNDQDKTQKLKVGHNSKANIMRKNLKLKL